MATVTAIRATTSTVPPIIIIKSKSKQQQFQMNISCPCCSNPWQKAAESFALSCEACMEIDEGTTGLDPKNMDLSVSPAENFFKHANGTWMASNPIPGEYPSWNTFIALHDANLTRLRNLLEGLTPPANPGGVAETVEAKVAAYWASALDEDAVEAAGLKPLEPVLAACDLVSTDRTAAVAKLHAEYGVNVLFSAGEGPDDKESSWCLLQLHQGGLGLPDRDYYFDEDKQDKRDLYVKHVTNVLTLLGESEETAAKGAEAVMKLEREYLASSHLTRTERRDPETTYNKYSVAKLTAQCKGGLDWAKYLEGIGKPSPKSVNVDSPVALASACRLLKEASDDDLKAYLRFHVAKSCSAHLGKAFVDEQFEFYSKALSGQQEQKPRWKRCQGMVAGALGEAVGELYVAKHFAGEAKTRALSVVERVRKSLEARLNEVPWMAEATRKKALEKMKAFGVKIGYPVSSTAAHGTQAAKHSG